MLNDSELYTSVICVMIHSYTQVTNMENKKEMLKFEIELYSPFVEYLKDYLAYFGSNKTVETLFMEMIYDKTKELYRMQQQQPYIDVKAFFEKYNYLASLANTPDEPEE